MTETYLKLGDVVNVRYGKGLPQESRSDMGEYFAYGSNGAVGRTNKKLIDYPTIIVGRKGAAGALYLTHEPSWAIDTTFYLEKKNKDVNFEFLFYQLQIKGLSKLAITTAMPGLNRGTLENVKIFFPTSNVQKIVAGRINSIQRAKELNDELIEKTEELFRSTLHAEFNSTNKKWDEYTLGEVAKITSGGTPSRNHSEYYGGNIRWVKSGELNNGFIFDTEEKLTEAGLNNSNARLLPVDTVLVAMYGATVGEVALLKVPATTNQAIAGLQVNQNLSDHYYIYLFMLHIAPKLVEKGIGGAQPNINQALVKNWVIALPPLQEQKATAKKLLAIRQYQNELGVQKAKINELFMSVLYRSFTGKLVEVQEEAKVNKFALQQAIAAILQQFERGEMVLAKVLYIAQEIYQVPLGFRFAAHNFGPYDAEIKRSLMAGMSTYNQFFTRKGTGAYALGVNAGKLFKYQSKTLGSMKAVVKDLLPYIKNADSSAIECLATVCKIIQDNKTLDLEVVKQKMTEWKKDRFSAAQVKGAYDFVLAKGWDKKLTT